MDNMLTCEIYTDGACRGNPGPGGWGACIVSFQTNTIIHELSGRENYATNNMMELMGAIQGLKWVQNNFSQNKIKIYTDSQYVKQGIGLWILKWKQNNWKTSTKQDVKNKELWCALDELNETLHPEWYWVKGHANNFWNNYADKLATCAI